MQVSDIRKIALVCNGHNPSSLRWALGYFREALIHAGVDVSWVDFSRGGTSAECDNADVVIVYRCVSNDMLNLVREWKRKGIFVMYFLDDYIFQVPCKYGGTILNWMAPVPFMQVSHCLMASSEHLLSKMPDKPKILKRTILGQEVMNYVKREYKKKDVLSVGLTAGSGRKNWTDELIMNFLNEVGKLAHKKVVFHYFGIKRFSADNVTCVPHEYIIPDDWKAWFSKLVELDLSVVINPLEENDEWCHCKSELKFIESGAMGVPVISSRISPFTEILKHGVNGFLASTPKEFAESAVLLEDEVLSEEISRKVRQEVEDLCDSAAHASKFLNDLTKVAKECQYCLKQIKEH